MAKATTTKKVPTFKKVFTIGGYGTKAAAEQDCRDYQHPDVWMYRTALFPNPQNFRVTVNVPIAKPVQPKKGVANPLYPWAVELTVTAKGERAQAWMAEFENRIRVVRVNK
jgi:hypothetical protein